MFNNENTFRLVRVVPKMVHGPRTNSSYDPKVTAEIVTQPGSKIVFGAFSGNLGGADLTFFFIIVTIKGTNNIDALKEHLLTCWRIYQCDYFIRDSASAHKSKIVTKFHDDHNINALEWPGNSPDIHQIENACNTLKKI